MLSNRKITDYLIIFWRAVAGLVLLACLGAGWFRASADPADPPVMHFAHDDAPVAASKCAECHQEQADSLAKAPHASTLQPASSSEIRNLFNELTFRDPNDKTLANPEITDTFISDPARPGLWRKNAAFPDSIPVDWVLGSGRHARTPVSLHPTMNGTLELIQHGVSWYPNVGLDLTLGTSDKSVAAAGWHGLGTRLNPSETADCFGCHCTWLPQTKGRIDLRRIVPGVQCTRCHANGAEHVQAMESDSSQSHMERWSDLSPLDSIRRCGECHRRDDHFTVRELRPDNPLLIRFAPVGLSQSRCFVSQDKMAPFESGEARRFDCVTCHNPHRPAETRAAYYVAKCLNCHGKEAGHAAVCSSSKTSQDCLACHMPKIEVQPHLRFTDHWIRTRLPIEE